MSIRTCHIGNINRLSLSSYKSYAQQKNWQNKISSKTKVSFYLNVYVILLKSKAFPRDVLKLKFIHLSVKTRQNNTTFGDSSQVFGLYAFLWFSSI